MATTPSLAMIPSGYKTQKVYSVLPTNGDGDFTFARSGTATRVNQSGLIETVGNNVPRLDYSNGGCPSLLLEPERINLITNSNNLTNWNGANMTRTLVDDLINPSNGLDASKLTQTSSGGYAWISRTFTGNETFSAFVKKDSSDFVRLYAANNTVYFDIVNGTIETEVGSDITDKSIVNYGNGWFRISMSVNSTAASYLRIYPASSGSSSSGTNSLFVYGVQLEQGSYPTSYIPTSGIVATRSAEITNGAGNTSTFNDSQGVLYAEVKGFEEIPSLNGYITISSPSVSFTNAAVLQFRDNGDLRFYFGGSASANIQFIDSTIDFTENNKIAVQYDSNGSNYKMFVNGVSISRYGSATNQSVNGLSELNLNYGSLALLAEVKDVRVYNTTLTDAELQALTQ